MRSSIALMAAARNNGEPFRLGLINIFVAIFGGEDGADRLQIVARVHSFGDLADLFAERLAVSQVHRPCERIDLRSCIVDIIFLGDPEAGGFQQPGKAVTDHRAPAMTHVQRAGRVRRDIFDVDPLVRTDGREAISASPSRTIVRSSSRQRRSSGAG